MQISTPMHPVYYYERAAGSTRLVYFIPLPTLLRLCESGLIDRRVLVDLPDGADIDCSKPRFAEFERDYGFKPELPPEVLHRAFYSLLSTTRRWRSFRGAGFIRADVLEQHATLVARTLRSRSLVEDEETLLPEDAKVAERGRQTRGLKARRAKMEKALREIPAEGVDPRQDLDRQQALIVEMGPGKPAEEAFASLLEAR